MARKRQRVDPLVAKLMRQSEVAARQGQLGSSRGTGKKRPGTPDRKLGINCFDPVNLTLFCLQGRDAGPSYRYRCLVQRMHNARFISVPQAEALARAYSKVHEGHAYFDSYARGRIDIFELFEALGMEYTP